MVKPFLRYWEKTRTIWMIVSWLCTGFQPVLNSQCMTDEVMQRNFERFPDLRKKHEDFNKKIKPHTGQVRPRTTATIPVVVHVVYKGNLENISEEQIRSQLDVLNEDFRRLNTNSVPAFFAPLAADMEIEFCLAGFDPDGNPTSGITRRETSWNNIGQLIAPDGRPRIHYTALGGTEAWPNEQYLNIWVCNIGGGILGFGTAPGAAPPEEDGVVIDPRYFGTTGLAKFNPPHDLGRTATHEIGHYFNLLHIWGPNEYSCSDDDEVDDTPVQRGPYLGCPAYPQLSCGNSAMFMNFMDYTNDACMALFTEGQKNRVWAVLNSARSGLPDSVNCATTNVKQGFNQKNQVRLFPNPASNELFVEIGFQASEFEFKIYDLTGKLCLEKTSDTVSDKQNLDVSGLPAGPYQLVLLFQEGLIQKTFFKN